MHAWENNWPRLGCGAGLRKEHNAAIIGQKTHLDWLEVITENHMDTKGLPWRNLLRARQDYPIVGHSVSLSIASTDPLNFDYLRRLREIYRIIEPAIVSDHLCWTGVDHENLHQLLPLPRTEEVVNHIVPRIVAAQEALGRQMLFENISTYIDFSESAFPEWEFVAAIAERADCGILLDINNIYVNAFNHGFSAEEYIDKIPIGRVGQFHLAGHADMGTYLFDAHGSAVCPEVWKLYRRAVERFGDVSTLIEWDADLPAFSVLEHEVLTAKQIQSAHHETPRISAAL